MSIISFRGNYSPANNIIMLPLNNGSPHHAGSSSPVSQPINHFHHLPFHHYVLILFSLSAFVFLNYLSRLWQNLHISSADLLPVRLSSAAAGSVLRVSAAVVLEHGQYAERLAGLNCRFYVLGLHGNHWWFKKRGGRIHLDSVIVPRDHHHHHCGLIKQ